MRSPGPPGWAVSCPDRRSSSAWIRARTASSSAGLVGAKFEPLEAVALFGIGEVADTRPQKYFGSWNDWLMSEEPTALPSRITRLPDTWLGKNTLPMTGHHQGIDDDR